MFGAVFAIEPCNGLGVSSQSWGRRFYGDGPAKPPVDSAIHLAHAAGTDLGFDFVGAEPSAAENAHVAGSLSWRD